MYGDTETTLDSKRRCRSWSLASKKYKEVNVDYREVHPQRCTQSIFPMTKLYSLLITGAGYEHWLQQSHSTSSQSAFNSSIGQPLSNSITPVRSLYSSASFSVRRQGQLRENIKADVTLNNTLTTSRISQPYLVEATP